jgi:hypothetical protein
MRKPTENPGPDAVPHGLDHLPREAQPILE